MFREKYLRISIVFIVISILVVGTYFVYQLLNNRDRVNSIRETLPDTFNLSSIPNDNANSNIVSKSDQGAMYITIKGTIKDLIEKNESQFIVLEVPVEDKSVIVNANLGKNDYVVSDNSLEVDNTNLTSSNIFVNKKVSEIVSIYRNKIGQEVTVKILASYEGEGNNECDSVCKEQLAITNKYKADNLRLLNLKTMDTKTIDVGLVMIIGTGIL